MKGQRQAQGQKPGKGGKRKEKKRRRSLEELGATSQQRSPFVSPAAPAKHGSDEKRVEPQHSIRIVKKHRSLKVQVALHRVPPKHIVFEPTATHLVVHTLGHTRKLYLKKRYPHGLRVQASEDSEAELEYGVLTAYLAITHDPEGVLEAFEKPAGTKRIREDSGDAEAVRPVEAKKRRVADPESESESEEEESSIEDENAAVYPGSDSEDEGGEASSMDGEEQMEQAPAKKEKKEKKKKSFITTSSALDLIEQINVKEDAVRGKKLSHDQERRERVEKQEDLREQRQAEKAKKKERERQKVLEEMQKSEKAKKKLKKLQKAEAAAASSPTTKTAKLAAPGSPGTPSGILKKVNSPKKPKRRVSFSPKVSVRPIPIVRREDSSDEEGGGWTLEQLMAFMAAASNKQRRSKKPVKRVSVDDDDEEDHDFNPFEDDADAEFWSQQIQSQKGADKKAKKKKKKGKKKHKKAGKASPLQ